MRKTVVLVFLRLSVLKVRSVNSVASTLSKMPKVLLFPLLFARCLILQIDYVRVFNLLPEEEVYVNPFPGPVQPTPAEFVVSRTYATKSRFFVTYM